MVLRDGRIGAHSVVATFNQEKVLVGAFSVIGQLHRLIVYSTNLGRPLVADETLQPRHQLLVLAAALAQTCRSRQVRTMFRVDTLSLLYLSMC